MQLAKDEEIVRTAKRHVHPDYELQKQARYVFAFEPINISDRVIVNTGEQVLPAGELIEIVDIAFPYQDSDSLQDERDNPDLVLVYAASPTRGAKFRPKTSYAIVQELMENYAAQGLVYLAPLSGPKGPETSKRAAIVEAKLDLPSLVNGEEHPTLQHAQEWLGELDATGIPKGEDCRTIVTEGLAQAIAYREAWAYKREAEIQQAKAGQGGRAATFPWERDYAKSIGVILTDANVMKRAASATASTGAMESSGSVAEGMLTKMLAEQNETLAARNNALETENAASKSAIAQLQADMATLMKELGVKKK